MTAQHYPLDPNTGRENSQITWSNGSIVAGIDGSIPPYQVCINALTEVVNVIAASGQTPTDDDLTQLLKAIRSMISNAIAGIQFPTYTAPTIPAYTGALGVAISNYIAKLDVASLPTTSTCVASDFIPFLQNGVDEKITVNDLAKVILAQAVAASSANFSNYQIYTSSGTFTPAQGCTGVEVQCWGAGGGGAYSGPVVAGGGGGGYSAGRYGVGAGLTYYVVIGAGGSGGTSGATAGGNGGTTHLLYPNNSADLLSATGGGGASVNTPGGGGSGYGGQAVYNGQAGGAGNAPGQGLYFPGYGGAAFGAGSNVTTGVVYNGYNYGVGGTGGNSTGAAGATPNGGTGAPGLMIIKQIIL